MKMKWQLIAIAGLIGTTAAATLLVYSLLNPRSTRSGLGWVLVYFVTFTLCVIVASYSSFKSRKRHYSLAINSIQPVNKGVLDRVRSDLAKVPSKEEVEKRLAMRNSGSLELANPDLNLIRFALRPRRVDRLLIGAVVEIMVWICLLVTWPILFFIGIYDFLGIARFGLRQSLRHAFRISRWARRYRINTHASLAKDTRIPILYLRPFSNDNSPGHGSPFRQETAEEQMAKYYRKLGPVIAIGEPKQRIPFLGAYRLYFDDDVWRDAATYLMSVSNILIHAGFSEGTLWEMAVARQTVTCERLHIGFFAWPVEEVGRREEYYSRFKILGEEILQTDFPEFLETATFMHFENNWKAVLK